MRTNLFECSEHSGSLRCGRLSLRPHVAVANFSLVQPKPAGGETLFSAKLSTIESPLSDLFTGVFLFLLFAYSKLCLSDQVAEPILYRPQDCHSYPGGYSVHAT